ncbi:pentapeptide repeat-containing protein [Candidatus Regiella endosymbiont of Tuberolachnus salignus]|uniref:pentapeptide repeat-containing protein n=1 Tax=Candidatus Regiella endosymbiont of Tuberolachnus salignus TaxID=3077956 RepID=UPI003BAF0DB4
MNQEEKEFALHFANLKGVHFERTDLNGLNLEGVNFNQTSLSKVDFTASRLPSIDQVVKLNYLQPLDCFLLSLIYTN